MATGDVEGNLERLRSLTRAIQYPQALDVDGLRDGNVASILPVIHYALLGYSRHVARHLSENGYALFAKSDARFMECTLKYLREEMNYRCPLTVAQIFSRGFAERKILLVCKRKHFELAKQNRNTQQAKKTVKRDTRMCNIANSINAINMDSLQVDEALSLALEKVLHKQVSDRMAAKQNSLDEEKQLENDANSTEDGGKENASTKIENRVNDDDCMQSKRFERPLTHGTVTSRKKNVDASNLDVSLSNCYEKLRTQIVEVAEKLETLIFNLKEDVEKITTSMKARLTSLENQTRFLEQAIPLKNIIERKGAADLLTTHPYLNSHITFNSRINPVHDPHEYISTSELISNIKARCNQTKEFLYGS
ncbi:hypothetical protein KP509_31G025700 [Ceratopteris richardii]|uniref:Centrosomal protein of 44 kDa n=1 Tax=Ceratopteris richardii TaxID=49495 RepID=A0A8T2QY87_CERRI|nr:hypothetical protein KP509_31G025700 [Ceratopteris richardii]